MPVDATINSAQLKLYGGPFLPEEGGDVSAFYVLDDSWREHGLTYNNRPNSSKTLTYTVENISSRSWYTWDITEDVRDTFLTDKVLTEALVCENTVRETWIRFYSRDLVVIYPESDNRPKLEVTYTIPITPTPTPARSYFNPTYNI
ncbi:MAG: DNRLRE domain-containing protein [Methanomicrobia archaeon]|nr:DNRLRE domain-containing protein [Methanomicrobia archaeon]